MDRSLSREAAEQRLARARRALTEWEYEAAHYALAAEGSLNGRPPSPLVVADCTQLAETITAELEALRAMQVSVTRSNAWALTQIISELETLALSLVATLNVLRRRARGRE